MVFLVMGILVLMDHVRKPESWQWMGFEEPVVPRAEKSIDTRINTSEIGDAANSDPQIAVGPSQLDLQLAGQNRDVESASKMEKDSLAATNSKWELSEFTETAEQDFWQKAYAKLSRNDKDAIFLALRSTRRKETLPMNQQLSLHVAIEKIDRRRQAYYAKVMSWLETLTSVEDKLEKTRWLKVLSDMRKIWDEGFRSDLLRIAKAKTVDETIGIDEPLGDLMQRRLDAIALTYVRDNSLNSKNGDMQTWFRWFDQLSETNQQELAKTSTGYVNHVQLFEQPNFYRGKVVSIKGTLKGAYTVPAPPNAYGIEKYFVYWIRPDDGSNNPIAVYALSQPTGMAPVRPSDVQNEKWDERNEAVEVHGRFVKKWVYVSADSSRLCPLVITNNIIWNRPPEKAETELPDTISIVTTLGIVSLIAIAIAGLASWSANQRIAKNRESLPSKLDGDFK